MERCRGDVVKVEQVPAWATPDRTPPLVTLPASLLRPIAKRDRLQ